jgi:hypothetical protein
MWFVPFGFASGLESIVQADDNGASLTDYHPRREPKNTENLLTIPWII